MSEIVRGVVIKEVYTGEADKIITVMAKDIGKVSISCRGSRKPKSKTVSGTTLFTYADFNIYTGMKFYKLNSVDIIKSFYDLSYDYDKLVVASYFVEVIDKVEFFDEENNNVLFLLIRAMQELIKNQDYKKVCAIFNIKLAQLLGFEPILDYCSLCGDIDVKFMYFGNEGIVCEKCNESFYLVDNNIKLIFEYVQSQDIKKIFSFESSAKIINLLYNITMKYINNHINIKVNSLNF
ncbi:MAG: DNA repair protein RecO [Lachnospirales bacterium]